MSLVSKVYRIRKTFNIQGLPNKENVQPAKLLPRVIGSESEVAPHLREISAYE